MATLEDLERRLLEIEARLRRQRRWTTVLAGLAVVAVLAALRSPEPEIVRGRRFEAVDQEGRVVGAFGIGVELAGVSDGGNRLGWILADPASETSAMAMVGEAATVEEGGGPAGSKSPFAMIHVEASSSVAAMLAGERSAYVELDWDDLRHVDLRAYDDGSELSFEAPPIGESEEETIEVLRLSHSSGRPTIQGWDDEGNATIDIK